MLIVIERISAQRIRGAVLRCTFPRCIAGATWQLIDRDMAANSTANIGERICCAAHITATYLNLRGAHVMALRQPARNYELRRLDTRRKPKRISLAHACARAPS
jgi:hypothetical protein